MKDYYYVPIVKWKAGEQVALSKLDTNHKETIRPLIEFVNGEDYLDQRKFITKLTQHEISNFYLDTIIADEGDREDFTSNIQQLLNEDISVCPIIFENEIQDIGVNLSKFCGEVAIRVPLPEDTEDYDSMFDDLANLKSVSGIDIDLIIDYEHIESSASRKSCYRETKALIHEFLLDSDLIRYIIFSSTSFPADISNVGAGDIVTYERHDFNLFNKLYSNTKFDDISNKFIYSDYGVTKFTDSEIDFRFLKYGVLPKLKYTTDTHYLYMKGQRDKGTHELSLGYPELSHNLISTSDYYGNDFSFGDNDIKERALKNKGPGNSTNWVTIAANHHITVVIEQLSNLYGF